MEYIHNNTDENEFIRKLVELIRSHSTAMKDIIEFLMTVMMELLLSISKMVSLMFL